jgi:hypothetical protein
MWGLLEPRRAAAAEAMNEAEDNLPAIEPISRNVPATLLLAFLRVNDHPPLSPRLTW